MPTSTFLTNLQDPYLLQLSRIISQFLLSFLFIYLSNISNDLSWNYYLAVQPVFSLVYLPMIAIFMWGVNIVVFRRYRINWISICEFHPQKSASAEDIFEIAASFMLICSSTLFLFSIQIPTIQAFQTVDFPFLMVLYVFLWSLLPLDILSRGTRYTFLRVILSVIMAPAGNVKFVDAFVGDILTSMARTFFDFEYTLCFYMNGDYLHSSWQRCSEATFFLLVISGLPLFWRFMQCLSHYKEHKNRDQLANAFKYMLALFTVLFNAWNGNLQAQSGWSKDRITWFCIYFISTLYSCFWDVRMDWGLMEKGSTYWGLRKNLVFPAWCYYILIVSNIYLRFFWCFMISPLPARFGMPRMFVAEISAILEVFRRFSWAILRFEWEHVNNGVGKLRNSDLISVTPAI